MGLLKDGRWYTDWYEPADDGSFVRSEQTFRNRVSREEGARFQPEKNRYHLYVSYACPWASRVLIMRKLKKLEDVLPLSVVHPLMLDDGWEFRTDKEGATGDRLMNKRFLREVYLEADPHFTGRVTVPVLWDSKHKTIVNNESRDIIRFLETEFDEYGDSSVNFCPPELQARVDDMIDANYNTVNNGVYRSGFATTQKAYEEAVNELFNRLDEIEDLLSKQRYLTGSQITEADWCLFVTLIRFDAVYYMHFKTSRRHIYEYPNLFNYMKELYQYPGVEDTINFNHIRNHYFRSHPGVNPHGIVPVQSEYSLNTPHNRERFK